MSMHHLNFKDRNTLILGALYSHIQYILSFIETNYPCRISSANLQTKVITQSDQCIISVLSLQQARSNAHMYQNTNIKTISKTKNPTISS